MSYPINKKLVISVASSALFDLHDCHRVFEEKGLQAYKAFQRHHEDEPLPKGAAFTFIQRLLTLNEMPGDVSPVEVILLSRNDPDTGLRVFNSIEHYGLDISRAAFREGQPIEDFMAAFNSKLFLSANKEDVSRAVRAGYPAGHIMSVAQAVDDNDSSIRIAFDFDGVLADDSSEKVFQANGDIKAFQQHEVSHADLPVPPGPLKPLLEGISAVQELEECLQAEGDYQPRLRTAIITARNASSHKRVIKTLRAWGIEVNEAFFLGGVDKSEILKNFKPHIYFDDQIGHLNQSKDFVPSVHIPFGVTNI